MFGRLRNPNQTETYDINDIKRPITKPSLDPRILQFNVRSWSRWFEGDFNAAKSLPGVVSRVSRVRASGPQGVFGCGRAALVGIQS